MRIPIAIHFAFGDEMWVKIAGTPLEIRQNLQGTKNVGFSNGFYLYGEFLQHLIQTSC